MPGAEGQRSWVRVHTPGSCFLGLPCSRGSQGCLQSLGCTNCLSHLWGLGLWGHWLVQAPGKPWHGWVLWGRAWEIGKLGNFPSLPLPSSSLERLLLTFGLICMWVGGSDGSS